MTDEGFFELKVENMNKLISSIEERGEGKAEVTHSPEKLRDNAHNLQYRSGWDFKDAVDAVLTDEAISRQIDRQAGVGLDVSEVVRELANEVVREYVKNILNDKEIQPAFRGKVKDLVDVRER